MAVVGTRGTKHTLQPQLLERATLVYAHPCACASGMRLVSVSACGIGNVIYP